jgi:lysozyme
MAEIKELDKEGLDFIKERESFSSTPYLDSGGVWTIGYGFTYYPDTGKKVTKTDRPITRDKADKMLLQLLDPYELAVYSTTRDDINQHQFNALVSLCYNIGTNGFKGSTVHRLVNASVVGEPLRDAFIMWSYDNHKFILGLKNRRVMEYEMYMTGITV